MTSKCLWRSYKEKGSLHTHAHVHTHTDPRKEDKVEVLSRAFIHPGVHMIPLNKLSHPRCLLSKY